MAPKHPDGPRMATISLDSVSKTYPDGSVGVEDVSIAVEDGEALVLLGPSGCGKSTTLRLVAGLESATSGRITLGGKDITHKKPRDRDLAMVFQSYALYPHLNVEENMGFALRMRGLSKRERRAKVMGAAERLGLTDVLAKRPAQLSGGQRQRVALGRAIVREPKAFLLDEPLSNLDPQRRVSTRQEIRRLQRELGVTTLYVTHDHEEAMALGDRVVILDGGRVAQIGTPDEVYHTPASAFVGSFLGSPKMNLLDATLELDGGRASARIGDAFSLSLDNKRLPGGVSEGDQVTVGVRPEALRIDPAGAVSGVVEDTESVGFALDVMLRAGLHEVRARLEGGSGVAIGDTLRLGVDADAVHVFVS